MQIDFLISSERSGSNLITKLLDNHSQYCGPSPVHLFRAFVPVIEENNNLNKYDNWQILVNDVIELFNSKIGIWKTSPSKEELLKIRPKNFTNIIDYIYSQEANSYGKNKCFIKEVQTYNLFPFIIKNYDNAKFIWLVRDPRDTALSWSRSPVHRGDIIRGAKTWKKDQEATLKLYLKHPNKILLIKYEELIGEQELTLKKICGFLSIPYEKNMSKFHKNSISIENASQTDNWKNLNKKIIRNNSKKYLQHLTKQQISYIEYYCKDEMVALKYDNEFPIIDNREFIALEKTLLPLERFEKEEYQNIDETEKLKRNHWTKAFNDIRNK